MTDTDREIGGRRQTGHGTGDTDGDDVIHVSDLLPGVIRIPVYYLFVVPLTFLVGFFGAFVLETMPWSLIGIVLGGTWLLFGMGTMQAVLLWVVGGVLLAGMVSYDGDAGPVGSARSYAARRAERYIKWSAWHSLKW